MRIISVVGKVDSRSIVYPIARALSLNGLTAVITDDGAYRRLYHGKSNIGNVNGIDLSISGHVDEVAVHSLDKSGVPYDNLIVVSTDYIHPDSNGIIACHGLDRSMMTKEEEQEEDDFIIPVKKEAEEPVDTAKEKKKVGFGKAKPKKEAEPEKSEETAESATGEQVTEEPEPVKEETPQERMIRLQNENPDKIAIPDGVPFVEVQIAYAAAPKHDIIGISLKDGLMSYIYNCEEQKRLGVIGDKNYNATLTKILSPIIDVDAKEISILLSKEEGVGAPGAGKKKK